MTEAERIHCGGSNCPFEYSCVDGCMYPNTKVIVIKDNERIKKDASRYVNTDILRSHNLEFAKVDYIAGATAENERLQQLIKEKEQQLNAVLRNSTKLMDKLKSAQELNRELVELVRKKFDGFTVHWSDFESLINKAK